MQAELDNVDHFEFAVVRVLAAGFLRAGAVQGFEALFHQNFLIVQF